MPPKTPTFQLPSLVGTRAIVTGGSDGIGLGIAMALAGAGADLLLPVRNETKGTAAADRIRAQHPEARVELAALDLASLDSVEAFADAQLAAGTPINLLVNNAGLMTPPQRGETTDGFELQFGTNHLGHFALTGRLLPLLKAGEARVTTQSSVVVRNRKMNWDDLNWRHSYNADRAYAQSKIACGLFGLELSRRSALGGWGITSNITHPGIAPTSLLAARPEVGRDVDTLRVRLIRWASRRGIGVGTLESAILPALMAATAADGDGKYYGPQWLGNAGGPPGLHRLWRVLDQPHDAARLWTVSEEMTGVTYT